MSSFLFVLLNLISRYVTSVSQQFLKNKDIVNLCIIFDISRHHIIGGVKIYLCVILLVPVCTMSVFVCVMPSQSASKSHVNCVKTYSKCDALLHKIHSKVLLVLQGLTDVGPCIIR